MNNMRNTLVGTFVLLGLLCVAYLTIKLGKMEVFSGQGFELSAHFQSASGLRVGADVELAGVAIGKVIEITLQNEPSQSTAIVKLRLNNDFQLGEDTIASIRTSGLIGDKYVSISKGGSDIILKNGGTITETESPVDLETLISKFAFGGV